MIFARADKVSLLGDSQHYQGDVFQAPHLVNNHFWSLIIEVDKMPQKRKRATIQRSRNLRSQAKGQKPSPIKKSNKKHQRNKILMIVQK